MSPIFFYVLVELGLRTKTWTKIISKYGKRALDINESFILVTLPYYSEVM